MTPTTYRVNTQKAIGEILEGEAIIINLQTGSYYSMNPAGSTLWDAITREVPITLTPALTPFIEYLIAEDLISASEAAPVAEPITVEGEPTIEKYDDMQEMLLADPIHDVDNAGWPQLKTE